LSKQVIFSKKRQGLIFSSPKTAANSKELESVADRVPKSILV